MLKIVIKVNDYFMKKYVDYCIFFFVKNVICFSNIWICGVYYEGLMVFYFVYLCDDYYKYVVDWLNYYEWGFCNGIIICNVDDYCVS